MKELAFVLSLLPFIKDVTPTPTKLLHPSPQNTDGIITLTLAVWLHSSCSLPPPPHGRLKKGPCQVA